MRVLTLVALLLAPAALQAQLPVSEIEHRLRPAVKLAGRPDTAFSIAERMRYYHVPAISVAVVENGRIVFAKGYGVAQFGGSTPVDTTTLFLAGSISKPVAATGILKQVEDGRLPLDADVNSVLKSWKLPESPHTATEKVTLRRLLTHTAGLTVWGFPGYRHDAPVPTVQQLLDGAPPANTAAVRNDIPPGTMWRYSGGGITIAQLMSEEVAGEPFARVMERLVLRPSGMTRSTFENPLPAARHGEAASGHERIDTPVPGRFHTYPEMAAAGLWTTAPELARWAIALSRAYNGEQGGAISPAMARQMIAKHAQQKPPYGNGHWGLGVAVGGEGDSISFSHGGRDEGFVATFTMWPKLGRGIFILTNGVSGPMMTEIQRAFGEVTGMPAPPRQERTVVSIEPATLAPLAGRYALPRGGDTVMLEVSWDDADGLTLFDPGAQRLLQLMHEGNGVFFDPSSGQRLSFEREGSEPTARGSAIVLQAGQQRVVAPREDPVPGPRAESPRR